MTRPRALPWLNGAVADPRELLGLVQDNYGHYTSLQVHDGGVQGLDLHLARLEAGTRQLFGAALDLPGVQGWIADAVDATGLASANVRITVFSRAFDFRKPAAAVPIDVLVDVMPFAAMPRTPLRVQPTVFARAVPEVKHTGKFPQFYLRRRAVEAGFDDVLFVDADGGVGEGGTWNIGFWSGDGVTWPRGPALHGVAEQLLAGGLEATGVAQRSVGVPLAGLGAFSGAFASNSNGLQPIGQIGDHVLGETAMEGMLSALDRALASQPRQPLRAVASRVVPPGLQPGPRPL